MIDMGVIWRKKDGELSKYHQVWIDDQHHTLCGHIAGEDAHVVEGHAPIAVALGVACKACHYLLFSGAAEYYRARRGGRLCR